MFHRLGFLLSGLISVVAAVPALAQPFRTVDPATGRTYELSQAAELWTDAVNNAGLLFVDGQQGYITTINNAAENAFILNFFPQYTNTAWIGFNDRVTEGTFVWANGEPVTYINWDVNEPNNSFGTEHYTQMKQSGRWNDLPSSLSEPSRLNYIIEFNTVLPPPPGVPEPGTVALAASMAAFGAFCSYRRRQRRK